LSFGPSDEIGYTCDSQMIVSFGACGFDSLLGQLDWIKTVILNDTRAHNHFGCKMIMDAFHILCARYKIIILGSISLRESWDTPECRDLMKQADIIIVNGEGSLHHGRRIDLLDIAKEFPSVLINTVYDKNPPTWFHKLKHFKYVSCRESFSAAQIRGMGLDCDITPDMTLSFLPDIKLINSPTGGRQDIGRIGSVVAKKDEYTDGENLTVRCGYIDFLDKANCYAKIISGRFHGICAAAMLGIPFCAWQSNSCKNEGIMHDMSVMQYYTPDWKKWNIEPPDSLPRTVTEYVNSAPDKIYTMFRKIRQSIGLV
jgi:hypothetical protein